MCGIIYRLRLEDTGYFASFRYVKGDFQRFDPEFFRIFRDTAGDVPLPSFFLFPVHDKVIGIHNDEISLLCFCSGLLRGEFP